MGTIPRGIRNCNPGNIRAGTFKFDGQVGIDNAGFRIFDTPENGIKALKTLLQRYISLGLNTPRLIMARYAPPIENDTHTYTNYIANHMHVDVDAVLTDKDIVALAKDIIFYENGEMPYSDQQF